MIEEVHIEDEPNEERIEAIQRACSIFLDVCRMHPETAPRGEEDIDHVVNEILRQDRDLSDSVNYTLAWRAVRGRREEAARREAEAEAREQTRRQEIEDYKRPSNRAETMSELRAGHTSASPAPFVPAREYSQEEIDHMSADNYRRLVLGHVSIADRQGRGTGRSVQEERNSLILADKIMNRAGVRKTRSIKVSQEEVAAREQRAGAIAADQAERRRLEEQRRQK